MNLDHYSVTIIAMEKECPDPINTVVISGGVHGDESSALELIRLWQKNPQMVERPSFKTAVIVSNEMACQQCVRFIDADMNEQFGYDKLYSAPDDSDPRELKIARQIAAALGGKQQGSSNPDFVVDCHSTDANMGVTIIVSTLTPFLTRLIGYTVSKCPWVNVLYTPDDRIQDESLDSLGRQGFTIENGCIPHGTINPIKAKQEGDVVQVILDFIDLWNRCESPTDPQPVVIFREMGDINMPNGGSISPNMKFADFQPVTNGTPVLINPDGSVVKWTGETIWPCFIDETHYVEEYGIAFSATMKENVCW